MACVAAATILAGAMAQGNLIWVANAVLLAFLLLIPRRLWPLFLGAGLLGHVIGTIVIHTPWQINVVDTPLDIFEAFLAATLMRSRSTRFPKFTQLRYLLHFVAFAVLIAPLTTGFLYAMVMALWQHTSFSLQFFQWTASDSLGACVVTPACVAIFRARTPGSSYSRMSLLHLVLFVALTIAILSQAWVPLSFLLYPMLILILLRHGLGWAASATLFVAAVGSWYTVNGQGPFANSIWFSRLEPAVILQVFVASAMFMLYSVSVVIEDLRATEHRLNEIASLHKLVMDNSRDIIIIADFEGRRSFVAAAGASWGGWSQEELRQRKSLDMVHPDDRPQLMATLGELRAGRDDALVECRVITSNGNYVWVEASLRTIRDPRTGVPTGILNNVREITQRKIAEQQLAEAYHAVEELAITDALTGLANRRHFDQYLTTEWRRGMRERSPLSLVLIDADLFKSYNDTYGHLRGDNCLKQIAEAIQDVVSRPGDLVARFGGEEFAVILPNTPADGGFQVAQEICAAMCSRQLPHSGNPVGVVTISAGCATLVPQLGQHSPSLIDCADQALYQAKGSGRNRACAYRPGGAGQPAAETGRDLIVLKSA
jgi:diguanylate cyclase (GGDEF)-like protein/PAS domain S-box-containing protein